jgi:hypothetical protein
VRAVASGTLIPVVTPELDILAVAPALPGEKPTASVISRRSEAIFRECAAGSPETALHLAKWRVPKAFGTLAMPYAEWDADGCTVIRSVLMKPEHAERAASIVDRIADWKRLSL